jgi:hypothetical protein
MPSVAKHLISEPLERLLKDAGDVLEGRTGTCSLAEVRTGALRRASELAERAPQFRRKMNRELFALGVPTLALYRTLRDDAGLEQAPAVALVDELLQVAYRRRLVSPVLRTLAGGAFRRLPVLRNTIARMAERSREPGGFVMRKLEPGPGELLALDVERCPLAELFAREGAPEVGPLICKLDDVMVEALGVELQRTGTIAAGATRCDFRYRRKG